jgi:hypothetical protein
VRCVVATSSLCHLSFLWRAPLDRCVRRQVSTDKRRSGREGKRCVASSQLRRRFSYIFMTCPIKLFRRRVRRCNGSKNKRRSGRKSDALYCRSPTATTNSYPVLEEAYFATACIASCIAMTQFQRNAGVSYNTSFRCDDAATERNALMGPRCNCALYAFVTSLSLTGKLIVLLIEKITFRINSEN